MDERVRFVARLLEGEKMTALCREFAISRKTGYKIFDRYKESGLEALTDRSRRSRRYGNQLPPQVEITNATASSGFSIAAVRWLVGFLKRPIAPAKRFHVACCSLATKEASVNGPVFSANAFLMRSVPTKVRGSPEASRTVTSTARKASKITEHTQAAIKASSTLSQYCCG